MIDRRGNRLLVTAALLVLLGGAGCSHKTEEAAPPPETAAAPAPADTTAPAPATQQGVTVSGVTLGKAVGADKKVTEATESFGKTDTIYASVATTGTAATAKLTARWTYDGKAGSKTVKEDSQTIAPTGDAVTEFHVSKPDGWPAGSYKVEILLDGSSASTKPFKVG